MRITQAHLDFWQAHKAPLPRWALFVKSQRIAAVDYLINTQSPETVRRARCSEPGNTLALLKSSRMRGELLLMLQALAQRPGEGLRELMVKRCNYARRWLRRYRQCSQVN
jgi:hypothetical protein